MSQLNKDTLEKIGKAIKVYRVYQEMCDQGSPILSEYQRLYAEPIWRGRLAIDLIQRLLRIKQVRQMVEMEKNIDALLYHKAIRNINQVERSLREILSRLFQDVTPLMLDIGTMAQRSSTF